MACPAVHMIPSVKYTTFQGDLRRGNLEVMQRVCPSWGGGPLRISKRMEGAIDRVQLNSSKAKPLRNLEPQ